MPARRHSHFASLLLVALSACAMKQPRPATVAELLKDSQQFADEPVVVSGRAGTVVFKQPERGSSGITFRLSDGTGSIQVVTEGTLDVREGQFVQVRGELREKPGEPPSLAASRIWILGGARAP